MAPSLVRGHDPRMDNVRSHMDHTHALQRSSLELQRQAGNLVKHAGGAASMPALSITLAHLEEALEAEALCFHLRRTAETLRGPQAACEASRTWTRRVAESETEALEPLEPARGAVCAPRHSS